MEYLSKIVKFFIESTSGIILGIRLFNENQGFMRRRQARNKSKAGVEFRIGAIPNSYFVTHISQFSKPTPGHFPAFGLVMFIAILSYHSKHKKHENTKEPKKSAILVTACGNGLFL